MEKSMNKKPNEGQTKADETVIKELTKGAS
jgi:hypothetical protein